MAAEDKVVLLVHPPEVVVVVEFADDPGGSGKIVVGLL